MSLKEDLKTLKENILDSLEPEVRDQLVQENKKLFSSFMREKAIKEGAQVPDVFFRDHNLQPVYLRDLRKNHHVVLSFYRGTWCPYCNLELQALSRINDKIKSKGARLIAVSPELYKFSENYIKKENLNFTVHTDLANKAADKFGLVFELPPKFRKIYKMLNVHLNKLNENDRWTLPVPATFIISKDGIITSTFINADYTKRMEPDDILSELDKLS